MADKIRPVLACSMLLLAGSFTLYGLRASLRFDQTASKQSAVPLFWPSSSALKPPVGRPQLLVFVHPFCSCTNATIAELGKLSVRRVPSATAPEINILFMRPAHSEWPRENALWREAKKLPGARVIWDEGGREAAKFGARTSGFVALYNGQGRLVFRGGVTGSRGHQGENYGLDQLIASINSQKVANKSSLVFGCALAGSKDSIGL
jgi:hypothetical protein